MALAGTKARRRLGLAESQGEPLAGREAWQRARATGLEFCFKANFKPHME